MPNVYRPIQEKFLTEGWGIGFQWAEGWTWHRVLGRTLSRMRKFTQGINKIATNGTQDFFELKDPNGQKIFDVLQRNAKNLVIHAGIGIKAPGLRMYVKWPSGVDLRPLPNTDPVTLAETFQGNSAYITAKESPYWRPTEAAEYWFPWTLDATFGFLNPDKTRVHMPVLNIELALYSIETLNPEESGDLETIKRMARGQIRTRFVTLGPAWDIKQYTLGRDWGVEPISLRSLRGGE